MNDPRAPRLFELPAESVAADAEAAAVAGDNDLLVATTSRDASASLPPSDSSGEPPSSSAAPPAPTAGASLLQDLNPAQREAVTHTGGHCLVLAGAGSGKTRVLTHRIAWLVDDRAVDSAAICALTFTNKAAAEMRGRVRRLIGTASRDLWLSTFHALGLRLLRSWSEAVAQGEGDALGLPASPAPGEQVPPVGFAVYNRDATLAVWRRSQATLRISPRDYDPGRLHSRCSSAVSKLQDPASWDADDQGWERRVAGRVWKQYKASMRQAGAVDFDDLLLLPLQLLSRNAPLRRATAARFQHLLVDEYQDTNRIQYRLIQALLAPGAELLVVGDEDQSIYRWRGADLNNVLDFQSDFPGAHVVRLEQNYRSTQPILSAAGSLVASNRGRLGKRLWTELDGGDLPSFVQCATDGEEANWVAAEVQEMGAADDHAARSDVAVLYRTNAQSRLFEEAFLRRRIPHRVVGGQRFFVRREVRDILAYLQLLVRNDDVALQRAIGAPPRGIGPKTVAALGEVLPTGGAAAALRHLCSQPAPEGAFADAGFSPTASERLRGFGTLLEDLRRRAASTTLSELIRITVERSGYARWLERDERSEDRLGNLAELAEAAREIADEEGGEAAAAREVVDEEDGAAMAPAQGLDAVSAFLDRWALLADADTDRDGEAGVRLMTVHAAKGLEFNVVFLAGLEEELFPHAAAIAEGDVEEERRLCYVGMTRARRRLYMSGARSRRINGREKWQEPSRFIGEIDPRFIALRDYLSPNAIGSSGYAPSSFTGLGGRTGQRRRANRSNASKPRHPPPNDPGGATRAARQRDLKEGATIVHPMFGPGVITTAVGGGDKLKLEIRFHKVGTKTVVAKYAKLQVPS